MKVKGSIAPSNAFSFEEQPKKPGYCLVRFYENVVASTEPGFEYDEYHLEMLMTDTIKDEILNNYDALMQQAKDLEISKLEFDPFAFKAQAKSIQAATQAIKSQVSVVTQVAKEQAPMMAAVKVFVNTTPNIPDDTALTIKPLFSTWDEVLNAGAELTAGRCIVDGDNLYRVVQNVTPASHQPPHADGMLAIYRPISKSHAGTLHDPIPWVSGMDCLPGQYFSYNGSVYLVANGGTMSPCVWAPDSGIWQWVKQ